MPCQDGPGRPTVGAVVRDRLATLTTVDVRALVHQVEALSQRVFGGGLDGEQRTPSEVVLARPQLTLRCYGPPGPAIPDARPVEGLLPVLLVPPLASSATCYDLRPGFSVAEHLTRTGRPTYLADYGRLSLRADQDLGIEHWVDDVLPVAVDAVSGRHGGAAVHLLSWSLGGTMSVATVAGHPELPVASVTMVGTPFDFETSSLLAPVRMARQVTGGRVGGSVIRLVGGTPRPVNMVAFYATDPVRVLTKPYFKFRNRHDVDLLEHIDAIDALMDRMGTYSGRTLAQLYHRFITLNEIAGGRLTLGEHTVDLAEVRVPVLAVAGSGDEVLGPASAVFHAREVMPNADVRTETAPGGHVGVLTGRSAPKHSWPLFDAFMAEHDVS